MKIILDNIRSSEESRFLNNRYLKIYNCTFDSKRRSVHILLFLFLLTGTYSLNAQTNYLKFSASTGASLETMPVTTTYLTLSAVAQSDALGGLAANTATVANFSDGSATTGALTSAATNRWTSVDLGSAQTISNVQLQANTAIADVNGAVLQVSTDNTNWTTVVSSISGVSLTALVNFNFTEVSARYVRVFRSASGTVGVSEFRVVNGNNVSLPLVAAAQANTASALTNIGFTFNFKGTDYTQFSVNANGLMRLGSTVITTESVNNITSNTNYPKLYALWDDISTGNNGSVTYRIKGIAPNRILVVDWKCNKANSTVAAYDLNFQVWLYEGTNKIEYYYGSGVALTSASVGMGGVGQTFGPTTAATKFISVNPNATPANTTISYQQEYEAVTTWPGSGTKYSFTPTVLTSVVAIPSDGNGSTEDIPSIDNYFGILNWDGVPTGGITANVQGSYTETTPPGISTTIKMSGLLLTATGTASKPIVLQWTGSGVKPVITASTGIGTNDYIIGLAGSDYVTIDGLSLQESASNISTATTTVFTELGIALFKQQVGTATIGANGCQHNLIQNNSIGLDRRGNATFATLMNGGYGQVLPGYSRGIALVYWDPLTNGTILTDQITAAPTSTGIVSTADVNSYNEMYNNTIDNCFYGIWNNDRWNGDSKAAKGNIAGASGKGNTITNFGAATGIVYTGGTVTWLTFSIKAPKAIFFGANLDANIQYNTINNGYANQYRVMGIEFSGYENGPVGPDPAKVVINNNSITNLYGNGAAPATTASDALGIVYSPGNNWLNKQKATDSVIIKNNTVDGLYTKLGKAIGITTGPNYSDVAYTTYANYSAVSATGKPAIITGNTLRNFKASGVTTSAIEVMGGIIWGANYSETYINNDTIQGLTLGDGTSNPGKASYLVGIGFMTANTGAIRTRLEIKGNIIQNDSIRAASAGTTAYGTARAIHAKQGATTTQISNNTIQNNDFNYALSNSQNSDDNSSLIAAEAYPSSGTGNLYIENNQLLNNTRRGIYGSTYNYFSGIRVTNSTKSQNQYIRYNTINGLSALSHASGTTTNNVLNGIAIEGSATLVSSVIDSNLVTGLTGDKLKTALLISNLNAPLNYNAFGLVGIYTQNTKRVDIRKNVIYNNTSSGAGTSATSANGVVGIMMVGGTAANIYTASNNFIYNLFAAAIVSPVALTGISIHKAGKFYVDHNTIVIGDPLTPTAVSSSGATFGVSGILYSPTALSTTRPSSEADQYTFRNNNISVQATNKGTGASMCLRQYAVSAANAMPGDISTKTNGNVYFINTGTYNYLYGQGTIANTTGGITNCYAISGATTNATYNLLSNTNFNNPCSNYENFMKGAEAISYADVNSGGTASQMQPYVGGTANPGKYFITSGSTSYVHNSTKVKTPFAITDDEPTVNTRPTLSATAGAYQSSGTYGAPKGTLLISYDPQPNIVCATGLSLVVTIDKVVSSVNVGSGAWAPRLYFKTSTNTNQVPGAAQNVNTFNGWKWVNATTVSGSSYTFNFDLSLLYPSGWTAPQTIEYFIIAADDASLGGIRYITKAGTSFTSCITNVDLYTSGGNSNTAHVPDIDVSPKTVSDNFVLADGASLTKSIYTNANNTTYTTNNTTSINVCPGDVISVNGIYRLTSTGEPMLNGNFRFETATNTAFSTGYTSTDVTDTNYNYTVGAHPQDLYVRMEMLCSGSVITSTATPYFRITTLGCPNVTSVQSDTTICLNENLPITITNPSGTTATIKEYFVADGKGKATFQPGNTTSISSAFTIAATDTAMSGAWRSAVGLAKTIFASGGYSQATLATETTNQGSSLDEQSGINFTTTDFVKLNSVVLYDDGSDATITTGFKVVLYEANSQTKLYETGTLATTDGAALTVTFTNWFIGPGTYNMVIESFDPNTPMTGLLISPASANFPYSIGSDLTLNGGIDDNDISTLSDQYNYFLTWNVTTYCTGANDNFNVTINSNQLFSCAPGLWLKAGVGVTTAGGSVSQWNDQSGKQRNATQATGTNQPLNDITTANLVNFNRLVKFDAADDYLSANSASFASGTAAKLYFVVADPTASGISSKPLLSHGTTSAYVELRMGDDDIGCALSSSIFTGSGYTPMTNTAETVSPKIGMWMAKTSATLGEMQFGVNALPITNSSGNVTVINPTNTVNYIGRSTPTSGTTYFDNKIFEIIHYADTLDPTRRLTVESYLAVKWGVTLEQQSDNDGDGMTGTAYLGSDGSPIWVNDQVYYKDIFGIGRDDASTLHQRQSKSVNSTALITIGNNNVIASNNASGNGNDIAIDHSYMMLANDGGTLTWLSTETPGDCEQKLEREWKVQETGTIGSVKLSVPDNSSSLTNKLPAILSTGKVYLVIDDDGDFTEGAVEYPMTLNGTNWEINYDFSDGQYFSFSTNTLASLPIVVTSGVVETTNASCDLSSYIHYYNSSVDNRTLISINSNGNTWSPTSLTVDNQGTLTGGAGTFTNSGAGYYQSTDGANTLRVTKRLHTIVAPGSYTTNGGVIVRVYYQNSDTTAMLTDAVPGGYSLSQKGWFKHSSSSAAAAVADMTTVSLSNSTLISPIGWGTENGIKYVEFKVTSFSTFGYMAAGGVALPITLEKIQLTTSECTATLSWKTATEDNLLHYEIQHSSNGSDYETVGITKPTGNGSNYQFEHKADGPSYYRLLMLDNDGKKMYSKVFFADINCNAQQSIILSPNPTKNMMTLRGVQPGATIQLLTLDGKLLKSDHSVTSVYSMDISQYSSGIYIVRINDGRKTVNMRVVRERD